MIQNKRLRKLVNNRIPVLNLMNLVGFLAPDSEYLLFEIHDEIPIFTKMVCKHDFDNTHAT